MITKHRRACASAPPGVLDPSASTGAVPDTKPGSPEADQGPHQAHHYCPAAIVRDGPEAGPGRDVYGATPSPGLAAPLRSLTCAPPLEPPAA